MLAPFLARAMGVEGYGAFIAALAASQVFAAFLDLGLTRILVKEGSAEPGRVGAHLFNILLIKGLLAALILLVLHLYALREGFLTPAYRLVLLLGLCKVADNFAVTFDGVFQVFKRMEFSAIILVAGRVGLLVAVLAGWARGAELLYFGWAYFLVSLVTALATAIIAAAKFARPRSGGLSLKETVGREGVFFALSSLLILAGSRLDVLVLREFADETTLGHYAVVAQVILVFQVLPVVLQTSVLPDLFRRGRHDREGLRGFWAAYLQRSLLLAMFPVLWALNYSHSIAMLFGEAFLPAAPWIRVLCGVLALRFVSLAAGNLLTALNRQWERTIWTAVGVGITFLLLLRFVPAYGIAGCVGALWIGETALALLSFMAALRQGYRPERGPLLRALAAALLAAFLIRLATNVFPDGILVGLAVTALLASLSILATRAASVGELLRLLRPAPKN